MKRFGSTVYVAFARAADLYLAVPGSPQTIAQIMLHFPLSWVRAVNCAYFIPNTGQGLGAIWEGGVRYQDQPQGWPTLVNQDGALTLRENGAAAFDGARFACAGGPMLVRDGQVTDIAREIAEQGFTGFSDGVKKAQTGAGLRDDGLLVHVVADSLTLTELAHVLREMGCHTAMKYDGGGSATLYTHNGTSATRQFGSDSRLFPAALVFHKEAAAPPDVAMAVPGRGRSVLGRSLAHVSQMEDQCHATNPDAPYLAELFLRTGDRLGVRGDIAYAQALLETNYFRFTGTVAFWQNNFGGLGATGPGNPGETFSSAAEGILAQQQHLYAYATARPLPSGLILADTRYDLVTWGSAPTVDALSGRWASDTSYGAKVESILDAILNRPVRAVGTAERAGWFAANSKWAAAVHASRESAAVQPVASSRKARTWSGIVVLREPAEARSHPEGGSAIATLPGSSYYPSFRTTLDGGWHMITLYDGSNAWVRSASLERIPTPASPPMEPTQAIVVIDPGHGGADNGATGPTGLREKAVNLAISAFLHERLAGAVGRVWMTRTADVDVSLGFRSDLATASGGNLFLSIHNNSHTSTSTGTETYYQCGFEQAQAALDASKRLGCLVHAQTLNHIARHNQGCGNCCPPFDRGLLCRLTSESFPRDYYWVLRSTFIPAVLVEGMFMSNPREEACLASPAVQEAIADALFQGIVEYLHGSSGSCNVRGPLYGL